MLSRRKMETPQLNHLAQSIEQHWHYCSTWIDYWFIYEYHSKCKVVVRSSWQETVDLGFVLLGARQQSVLVILRYLMLPGGSDSVSSSFTVRDITMINRIRSAVRWTLRTWHISLLSEQSIVSECHCLM